MHSAFIRNTGYRKNGAARLRAISRAMPTMRIMRPSPSTRPAEQAGRLHDQHDRHDDEEHRGRSLRIEHLGQSLDVTEPAAGDTRSEQRRVGHEGVMTGTTKA